MGLTGTARARACAIITAAALVTLGGVPATAAAAGPTNVAAPSGMLVIDPLWQTSTGQVTDGTVVMSDATMVVASGGIDTPGECRVGLPITRRPGQGDWIAVPFAVDATGCRVAFEFGSYVSGGPGHQGSASATSVAISPDKATDYCSWIQTYWSNGLVTANSVEDDLCWQGDGTYVLAIWNATDYRYWYSPRGWSEVYHSGPSAHNNGTNATIVTYDQFSNSQGSMYYSPNGMIVYGNGSSSFANQFSYKTGGNSDMKEYIRGGS
jgi:hypothetical protein